MKAPAPPGTEVGLYVDLVARVAVGDIIETRKGRRYFVVSVRVQERGKHRGRQHLRALVLAEGERPVQLGGGEPRVHRINWYRRRRGGVRK